MKKSRLLPIIGIVLFVYIISRVNISKVLEGFGRINIFLFGFTLLILGAQHFLKGIRWKIIIDSYNIRYPVLSSVKGWMIGFSLSLITPGKVGDFARAYYLKDKLETGKSLTTVMADRVIDIFVLFVMAVIGIYFFVNSYVKDDFLLYGTYALFAAFIAAIIIFSKKSIATKFLRQFYRFAPKKYAVRMKKVYHDFYLGLEILLKKKKRIIVVGLVTISMWLISILTGYTLALAMGLNISYLFLLMVTPIVMIILALPISFSGIGTRDAMMIFFFSYVGISAEATLSYTIMNLVVDYIFGAIGFILFFRNPIKLDKKE